MRGRGARGLQLLRRLPGPARLLEGLADLQIDGAAQDRIAIAVRIFRQELIADPLGLFQLRQPAGHGLRLARVDRPEA